MSSKRYVTRRVTKLTGRSQNDDAVHEVFESELTRINRELCEHEGGEWSFVGMVGLTSWAIFEGLATD